MSRRMAIRFLFAIRASLWCAVLVSAVLAHALPRKTRNIEIYVDCEHAQPPQPAVIYGFIQGSGKITADRQPAGFYRIRNPPNIVAQGTVGSVRFGTLRSSCVESSMDMVGSDVVAVFTFHCAQETVWPQLRVDTGTTNVWISYARALAKEQSNSVSCAEEYPTEMIRAGVVGSVAEQRESIYFYFGTDPKDLFYQKYPLLIERGKFGRKPISRRSLTNKEITDDYRRRMQKIGPNNLKILKDADILDPAIENVTVEVVK